MKQRFPVWRCLAAAMIALVLVPLSAAAYSQYFSTRCGSCHSHMNDSPTCDGCHHHRGTLTASADHSSYYPGATVTVTLRGGTRGG